MFKKVMNYVTSPTGLDINRRLKEFIRVQQIGIIKTFCTMSSTT